jgi:hypothetical protein
LPIAPSLIDQTEIPSDVYPPDNRA